MYSNWSTICHLVTFTLAMLGGGARADTLHVPGQYATIQAAINAATDGDEVVVANGVHSGPGNANISFLGKAITVRSASGDPAACVVDCKGDAAGFIFENGETRAARLESITITAALGSGIRISDSSPSVAFASCRFPVDAGSPSIKATHPSPTARRTTMRGALICWQRRRN